jgi:hypothetical protein
MYDTMSRPLAFQEIYQRTEQDEPRSRVVTKAVDEIAALIGHDDLIAVDDHLLH